MNGKELKAASVPGTTMKDWAKMIGITPAAGTELAADAEVTIAVSLGPELVEVPDVVGQLAAEASEALRNADLCVDDARLREAVDALLDHRAKVEAFGGPRLVLHARHDTLVRPEHGIRLAEWGGDRAALELFDTGDHNTIHAFNGRRILERVAAFAHDATPEAPAYAPPGTSDLPVRAGIGAALEFAETLGLDNDWAYRIVNQVGNYGEVFDRNVGNGSPLKLARGINSLWTQGGLLYSPPFK